MTAVNTAFLMPVRISRIIAVLLLLAGHTEGHGIVDASCIFEIVAPFFDHEKETRSSVSVSFM